ncbi:MAG TPA: methyltransferase domain-containing protein [Chitinivibrionales bacterium]|nr:methyltransferase domain-containing protein [Chitinivibrionales bacterium]
MNEPAENIKQKIIAKYDREAINKDTREWLQQGGTERVPESPAAHYFIDRKVAEALRLCGTDVSRASRALEIGCSFGHMTALLSKKFDSLTAVDISPESIKIAEKRLKHYGIANVTFIADDAETLSRLPDDAFDVVFSFSTIRFCPRPHEALKAIHKKLKPGGIAVIDFPNRLSPWHIFIKRAAGINRHIFDHLFSTVEAQRLFLDAGFGVRRIKKFLFISKRFPSSLLPLLKAAETVLEKVPFAADFAGIIMIKGVKK